MVSALLSVAGVVLIFVIAIGRTWTSWEDRDVRTHIFIMNQSNRRAIDGVRTSVQKNAASIAAGQIRRERLGKRCDLVERPCLFHLELTSSCSMAGLQIGRFRNLCHQERAEARPVHNANSLGRLNRWFVIVPPRECKFLVRRYGLVALEGVKDCYIPGCSALQAHSPFRIYFCERWRRALPAAAECREWNSLRLR